MAHHLVNDNGVIQMNRKHQYYYQVQMQMYVLDVNYCDFVAWNKLKLLTIRVLKDQAFWDVEYPKTTIFFYQVILPELLGMYYTRKPTNEC